MKRFISILFIMALVFTCVPQFNEVSHAYTQKSAITKIKKQYKSCGKYHGSGQCYGYAVKMHNLVAKKTKHVNYYRSLTSKNAKKILKGLKAGSHVRISHHSLVVLKAGNNTITWCDNNYGSVRNRVHYWSGSYSYFDKVYKRHSTIEWVDKTVAYK
ncbi:MAG: hypothetical protein MJ145_03090 [Clostridia bacterium]|nr:hypothetical protein [Clostridia bacterium]